MLSKVNEMKLTLLVCVALANLGAESRLVTGQFETKLIPAPLKFAALLRRCSTSCTAAAATTAF